MGDENITVLDRMRAAGIDEDRARNYLKSGAVKIDGEVVTDPDALAPRPSRIVILVP